MGGQGKDGRTARGGIHWRLEGGKGANGRPVEEWQKKEKMGHQGPLPQSLARTTDGWDALQVSLSQALLRTYVYACTFVPVSQPVQKVPLRWTAEGQPAQHRASTERLLRQGQLLDNTREASTRSRRSMRREHGQPLSKILSFVMSGEHLRCFVGAIYWNAERSTQARGGHVLRTFRQQSGHCGTWRRCIERVA